MCQLFSGDVLQGSDLLPMLKICPIQDHGHSCYFVYVSQGVILCHFKPKPSVIIIN